MFLKPKLDGLGGFSGPLFILVDRNMQRLSLVGSTMHQFGVLKLYQINRKFKILPCILSLLNQNILTSFVSSSLNEINVKLF